MTGPKVQLTQFNVAHAATKIPKGTFEDARHRPREKLLDRQLVKGSKWPYRPKAVCHISRELTLALVPYFIITLTYYG